MVSETIERKRKPWWPDLKSHEVDAQVTVWRESGRVLSDAAAVAVASWWQSPGRVGHVLASFASGCEVSREDLRDDIDRSMTEAEAQTSRDFGVELQALRAWLDVQP